MGAMQSFTGRSAELRLRGVPVRVRWPAGPLPPVVVVLADAAAPADDLLCDALCAGLGALVLQTFWEDGPERAAGALDWAADHAAELDGDPRRVLVAGRGAAAVAASTLALRAGESGWPRLAGQVLVVWQACAADEVRAAAAPAAATIVTPVADCAFSQRLRAAGAEVHELVDPRVDPREHPDQPFLPALVDTLRRSLRD
jgi:acetyl esterase